MKTILVGCVRSLRFIGVIATDIGKVQDWKSEPYFTLEYVTKNFRLLGQLLISVICLVPEVGFFAHAQSNYYR